MNRSSLLIISLVFALTGCGKSNIDSPEKPQIRLLDKVVKRFSWRTDSALIYYQYDSKFRISKNLAITGAYSRFFSYRGDELLGIEDYEGGFGAWAFGYDNGTISRAAFSSKNVPAVNYTYQYSLADGKVIKREVASKFTHTFTYSGHNVASWSLVGGGTTTFQYGTNKNPYHDPSYKYLLTIPDLEGDDVYSENNLIKITTQQDPFLGAQYTYTFFPDGYPATATIKATVGDDPNTFRYTYITFYYKLFDR